MAKLIKNHTSRCIARDSDVNFTCIRCAVQKGKKASLSCRMPYCTLCWKKWCIAMEYDSNLSVCANERCIELGIDPETINQYNIEKLIGITKKSNKNHISSGRRKSASIERRRRLDRLEKGINSNDIKPEHSLNIPDESDDVDMMDFTYTGDAAIHPLESVKVEWQVLQNNHVDLTGRRESIHTTIGVEFVDLTY